MPPVIVRAASDSNDTLSSMPAELITVTFCLLPSLSDVLALAATSHQLRHIWTTNVTSIFTKVAQRGIPCHRYARNFLTDQGGPALESPTLSIDDVIRIVRNSHIIEKAICQFEREIVPWIKTDDFSMEKIEEYYGAGVHNHPSSLTRTERRRFIRSCYQLWGLMKLDSAEWQSRLETLTLKQLYQVYEMSILTQSIGREEFVPTPRNPYAELYSPRAINEGRSEKRIALEVSIRQHLKSTYQRIHQGDAELVDAYSLYQGSMGFIVMWDHWQSCFMEIVYLRRPPFRSSRPALEKQYIWDSSSDEVGEEG